jgi:hypothetical protein
MGIKVLYKAGTGGMVWGIWCDQIIVNESEVEDKLKEGWLYSPLDIPIEDVVFPDGSVNDEPPIDGAVEEVKKRGRPAKGV